MPSQVIDFIRKTNDTARQASDALKIKNRFVDSYRQVVNPENTQGKQETANIDLGNGVLSNKVTFRNAKLGEKTGLQKISLLKSNGDKEDIFLIVPERESVGYGEIRSLNDAEKLKNAGKKKEVNLVMGTTRDMWDATKERNDKRPDVSYGDQMRDFGAAIATPVTAALDLVAGNTLMSNIYKNELSNYTGEDKAVGLGGTGTSEGQIFGMIASDGEMITPQETKYFLTNLKKNGYKGVAEIEQPERVQEHRGPAYVPGDILLGLLGLQPNRGAVGYTFKEPENNTNYKNFVKNLRNSRSN